MHIVLSELGPALTIGDRTYKAIREAIITRRLKPGTRLIIDRLANELKVSRTPVSEALTKLEREGFIELVPHRGARVVTIAKQDIAEIYALREVIEGLSASLAAQNCSVDDLLRLTAFTERGKAVLESHDLDSYADIDLEFHRRIRLAGGNQRLQAFMEALDGQVRIMMPTSVALPGRGEMSVIEHRRILTALEAKDPKGAERAMRDHVAKARAAILAHWKE